MELSFSWINATHKKIFLILVFAFILKCLLASIVPLFGDEAYYVYWGTHFFGGYYDHPPMIGWWEYAALYFSNALMVIRLPMIISVTLIAIALYFFVVRYAPKKTSLFIAALWFFSPITFLEVFAAPDILLLFFSFFSSMVFFIAFENFKKNQKKTANLLFLCTGILWGCAFLSKYFAIFILPAYLLYFYINRQTPFIWLGIIYCLLGATPFVLQHIYWNYTHCWSTFYFHLHRYDNYSYKPLVNAFTFLLFFTMYAMPLCLVDALRKEEVTHYISLKKYSFYMWIIPALCFLITALIGKSQGLHWYFFIFPYFFIWLGLRLSPNTLKRRLFQTGAATTVIYLIVLGIFLFPPKTLTRYLTNHYQVDAQFIINEKDFMKKIIPYLKDVDLVVFKSYSTASVFNHALMRYKDTIDHHLAVGVLNLGKYGRVFDTTVDYNAFDRKNVLFVLNNPSNFTLYFKQVTKIKIPIGNKSNLSDIPLTKGVDFNAQKYIIDLVRPQLDKFYSPGCQLPQCNG